MAETNMSPTVAPRSADTLQGGQAVPCVPGAGTRGRHRIWLCLAQNLLGIFSALDLISSWDQPLPRWKRQPYPVIVLCPPVATPGKQSPGLLFFILSKLAVTPLRGRQVPAPDQLPAVSPLAFQTRRESSSACVSLLLLLGLHTCTGGL